MSKGVNKVILVGCLGQDPVIRHTQDNKPVASISLATSDGYKDKDGKWIEQTEWHKVVLFGRLAEVVEDYLTKGAKVYIEGKLKTRKWDKDGQPQYTTEIVANEMQMLDSKGGDKSVNEEPRKETDKERYERVRGKRHTTNPEDFVDDDVPF